MCHLCREEIDEVQRLGKSSRGKNYYEVVSSTRRKQKLKVENVKQLGLAALDDILIEDND